MTLRQKLLTLDIIVLLTIALFALLINEFVGKEFLAKYFIPIMLTVYYVGRHIPLIIVKKHMKQ